MTGSFVPVVHGATPGRPDEDDTREAADAIAASLARLGHETAIITLDLDLTPIEHLAARRPAVIFNLVEALRGSGRLAVLAFHVLEHFGLPITGAGAEAFASTASKLTTKRILEAARLPTPSWWTRDGIAPSAGQRVIVKSVDEHASIGMDKDSVVDGERAVAEITRRQETFGGRFFAEAFIEGREFSVAILERNGEPTVLPIQETVLTGLPAGYPAIVDYAAKWDPASAAYHATPRRFGLEAAEPRLAEKIRDLAVATWRAFELSGYARVDFRVDASGTPFILEANANPCLTPDAGFIATAGEAGLGFDAVIAEIVKAARLRASDNRQC